MNRGLVIVALLSGCFSTPGFHGGTDDDDMPRDGALDDGSGDGDAAPPVAGCWSTPTPFSELDNVAGEPTMNAGQTVAMWVVSHLDGMGSSAYDIAWASRAELGAPWEVKPNPPFALSFGTADPDPSLSADGLEVFFHQGNAGQHIWVSTRPDLNAAWGTPTMIAAVMETVIAGVDIDRKFGKVLYYTTPNGTGDDTLHSVSRTAVGQAFTGPVRNESSFDVRLPSVSPDGTEVFYAPLDMPGIYVRVRSSATGVFPNVTKQVFPADTHQIRDPEVLADGDTMIMGYGSTIAVSTRTDCP